MKLLGFSSELEAKILNLHQKAMLVVKENSLTYSDSNLIVSFNPRMRSTAGRAFVLSNKIDLNPHLLQNDEYSFASTYLHELAHIVAQQNYGNRERGHGFLWAGIMRALGQKPERCHSLNTKHLRRKMTRFIYVCPKLECKNKTPFTLTPQKHKRSQGYACRDCQSAIKFTGKFIKI